MSKYYLTSKGIHVKSMTSTNPIPMADICRSLNSYNTIVKDQRSDIDTYEYDNSALLDGVLLVNIKNSKLCELILSTYEEGFCSGENNKHNEPSLSSWLRSDSHLKKQRIMRL